MAKRKRREFTGELNTKLTKESVYKRKKFSAFPTADEIAKLNQLYQDAINKKLLLLLKEYKIAPHITNATDGTEITLAHDGMYRDLAIALAKEIVPGFQWERSGVATKWTDEKLAYLVVDFDHVKKINKLRTDVDTAAVMASREPWINFIGKKEGAGIDANPSEVIRQLYSTNKDNGWIKHILEFYKSTIKNKGQESWDSFIYHRIIRPN